MRDTPHIIDALKKTVACGQVKWSGWSGEHISGTFPRTQFMTKIFMKELLLVVESKLSTPQSSTKVGFWTSLEEGSSCIIPTWDPRWSWDPAVRKDKLSEYPCHRHISINFDHHICKRPAWEHVSCHKFSNDIQTWNKSSSIESYRSGHL